MWKAMECKNTTQSLEGDDGMVEFECENPEWIVSKSLLEVNDVCTRTLQEFLLHTTHAENDASAETLERRMDDLIERHERLVTELELAKQAAGELE